VEEGPGDMFAVPPHRVPERLSVGQGGYGLS
jgi:hypothetical protein